MKLSDFTGSWRIDRRIEDRRMGRTGILQGRAQFTPDGEGLLYAETGTLRFEGQPDLTARQSYLWRQDGDDIAVLFSDGRPFHRIAAEATAPEIAHDCPPDAYRVRYDFTGWPEWQTVWRVTGPRKDYAMTTRYTRMPV